MSYLIPSLLSFHLHAVVQTDLFRKGLSTAESDSQLTVEKTLSPTPGHRGWLCFTVRTFISSSEEQKIKFSAPTAEIFCCGIQRLNSIALLRLATCIE